MKKILFILCWFILISNSYAQEIFYLVDKAGEERLNFIGYSDKSPIFYKHSSSQSLYSVKQFNSDSLYLQYLRDTRYSNDKEMHLLWVDNDMEIYTVRKINSTHDENLIIATNNKIDTVYFKFDSFYEDDIQPIVLTTDRNTLLIVQPKGHQDGDLGWYYGNILHINLTNNPLIIEKLPITGIQMQFTDNYLYYKGGNGLLQDAILRVEIPKWEQIDTLAFYTGYWVVENSILYTEVGRYKGQDKWFENNRFIAYSIDKMKCAVISQKSPGSMDRQPIVFNDQYYRFFSQGLVKIVLPKITDFPYKQTFPNQ